ncbi:MAG: SUF system NifU family Fe-S cluster assembly protein [Candidatus Omnitrophica bacterium]|nr:SUF system NifU family Fe-S cluster assembly protein [Candidatus Omnitrophota bacterium]
MRDELYQQTILEHNRNPRNFRKIEGATHAAEGYNPLCGDHLWVYMKVDSCGVIEDASFEGSGCAISKASASMMTTSLKGKGVQEAQILFEEFHKLVIGELKPDEKPNHLEKLTVFSGIWQYPARVKCASLSWHAMHGALEKAKTVSTE